MLKDGVNFILLYYVLFQKMHQILENLEDGRHMLSWKLHRINENQQEVAFGPKIHVELFVESNGLLENKGISEVEISMQNQNNTPIFFTTKHQDSYLFDFFAASFYLVSRYEEYLPHLKDSYNRYKAEESIAYKYGFLEKPIINIWAKNFIINHKCWCTKYSFVICIVSSNFKFFFNVCDFMFFY